MGQHLQQTIHTDFANGAKNISMKNEIKLKQNKQFRNSHRRCSLRNGILRNCAKFTGKHLCQSLFFNKVAGLRPLFKKRLWHRCFPVNFTKFLRAPFLQNTSGRLLLTVTTVLQLLLTYLFIKHITACPNAEFFLVRIFLYSD